MQRRNEDEELSYILLAAMLVAALAVSCTAEVIDDAELATITFASGEGSRSLVVSREGFDAEQYVWYYTAAKNDKGPDTGAKSEKTLVGGTGKLTSPIEGISLGRWDFQLFGYDKKIDEGGVVVYTGSAIGAEVSKGHDNVISVKVEPQKNGKGCIDVSKDIVLVDGNGNATSYKASNVEIKGLDTGFSKSLVVSDEWKVEAPSGSYAVTVRFVSESGTEHASTTKYFNVYDGLTTKVSGTLEEMTSSVSFDVKSDDIGLSISENKTIGSENVYKFGFSPVSSETTIGKDEQGTTITGSFKKTNDESSATINLVVYNTASAAQRFSIENGDAVVAGFDFKLDNASIENGSFVEVSTYIGMGYTNPKVVYKGDVSEVFETSYNSEDGILTFKTKHFSEYYVTTEDACVLNVNSNKKYIDLQDAIDNADDGDTIRLLGDVVLENTVVVDKKLTLDLEGRTISNISDLWNESTGDWSLISVRKGGRLRIEGDGFFTVNGIINEKKIDLFSLDVQGGGEITIDSGTFTGIDDAVYGYEGFVYVRGGSFSAEGKDSRGQYVLNCYNAKYDAKKTNIIVTGGTFKNFNPAQCCDYPDTTHDTNFVAEGYISVKDEDGISYTVREKRDSDIAMVDGVVYSSLSNAISAAKDKDIVRLLNDFDGTVSIIGKDLMIDFNGYVISGGIGIGCNYDSYWSEGNPSTVVFIDSRENGGITTSDDYGALRIKNGSNVLVKGGSFVAEHSKSYSRVIRLEDSTLEIEGGSFINKSAGSYSRVVEVGLGTECTGDITIKGGCFSSVSDYGVIVYGDSSAVVKLLVEDGSFSIYGNYGLFTDVYGKVTVNDCEFSSVWNQVFNPRKSSSEFNSSNNITINGGVFTLGNGVSSHLGGFVYCNRTLSNAYGYEKGMLELRGGKINYDMHPLILEDSGCSAILDSDGYYVIKPN